MPMFSSPIPRAVQPRYNEGANVGAVSVRDDRANSKQWQKNRIVGNQMRQDGAAFALLQRRVAQLRKGKTGYEVSQSKIPPFSIYKIDPPADGTASITFDSTGAQVAITVDSNVPTDFSAIPPTVNPRTDAWRFYQVRSGYVQVRPYFSLIGSLGGFYSGYFKDYSDLYRVYDVCDGITPEGFPPGNTNGKPWDTEAKTLGAGASNLFSPLVIPSLAGDDTDLDFDGNILFSFWLTIIPDTSSSDNITITLNGWRWSYSAIGSYVNSPFPGASPNMIPIGVIKSQQANFDSPTSPNPYDLIIDQIQSGHVINRYTPGMLGVSGPFGPTPETPTNPPNPTDSVIGPTIYRGHWQDDVSIQDSVFYPGDLVAYKVTGRVIPPAYTVTETFLLLCTNVAFTTDPLFDTTFIVLNGYRGTFDNFGGINDLA